MEKESRGFFNSPVIRRNTPIKRLGLSRKRKICDSDTSSNAKISACDEKFLNSPSPSEMFDLDKKQLNHTKIYKNENNNHTENYEEKIELLKLKIADQENKLKTLMCNNSSIEQLEDLIDLWKNGCKNTFLYFSELLKKRESDNIDLKAVLNNLGVWETMIKNFQDDPEISL